MQKIKKLSWEYSIWLSASREAQPNALFKTYHKIHHQKHNNFQLSYQDMAANATEHLQARVIPEWAHT